MDGCRAPDWFYVPNVPPMLDGTFRRSYVLWHEKIPPLVIIEYASGGGSRERDRTPRKGKFWIYEQAIEARYYAIFEIEAGRLELHRLEQGCYVEMPINEAGRLTIPELGVELGVWKGAYQGIVTPWLRFWDAATGLMMLHAEERTEIQWERAESAKQRYLAAMQQIEAIRLQIAAQPQTGALRRRADALADRLRAMGIDPEAA